MDEFPSLPGLGWSVTKSPKFATRVQTALSGRELRVLDQPYPIWTWTLTYNFLRDKNDTHRGSGVGVGYDELRTLGGFFLRQQGMFQTFLYNDQTDNSATGQYIGTGDGINTQFQLSRQWNGFFEPITQPAVITNIYVNGISVGYALQPNGIIAISPAPAAGLLVTATYLYKWPSRFTLDTLDFDNFMYQLWELKKISFQSVLLP
jgi:uncharacterized protein (TIGR02217 family)